MNSVRVLRCTALSLLTAAVALGTIGCTSTPGSAPPSSTSLTTSSTTSATATDTGAATEAKDDVLVTSCTRDPDSDLGRATVVITNTTSGPASYFVRLTFVAGPTKARYSSGQPKIYPQIDPGASVTTVFTSTSPVPSEFTCVIDQLTRS